MISLGSGNIPELLSTISLRSSIITVRQSLFNLKLENIEFLDTEVFMVKKEK